MCEPTTIIAASTAVAGAYSSYQQGQAQSRALGTQATYADQAAVRAQGVGAIREQRAARARGQAVGAQVAAQGASGFTIESQAAEAADTDFIGTLDLMAERNNTAAEVWGYQREAASLREAASNARRSGNVAAVAQLAAGAYTTFGTGVEAGLWKGGAGKDLGWKRFATRNWKVM